MGAVLGWLVPAPVGARIPRPAVVVLVAVGTLLAYALAPRRLSSTFGVDLDAFMFGLLLGIAAAVAVRVGPRAWPWMAAAAGIGAAFSLRADVGDGAAVLLLALIAAGELWLVPALLCRTGAWRLGDATELLRYAAVVLAVAVPAGLLAAVIVSVGTEAGGDPIRLWWLWSVDDVFGLLCLSPVVLRLGLVRRVRWRSAVEYTVYVAYTVAVSYLLFFRITSDQPGVFGWPYLAVLMAAAAAVRFGVGAAMPLVAVASLAALVGTVSGTGTFALRSATISERIVMAEMFGVVVSTLILAVAVLHEARERALRNTADSLRLLHEVIDAGQSAIFVKDYAAHADSDGRYILVNAAWEDANGLSGQVAVGKRDDELFDPERARLYVERDQEVLAAQEAVRTDDTVIDSTGRYVSFRTDKFPLRDADGRIWGVGGIAVDVTSVLRSQHREARQAALLHAVFELSPTPAARVAVGGSSTYTLVAVNAAALALVLETRQAPRGLELLSYVHADDAADVVELIESAADRHGAREVLSARREIRLLRSDGRERWVLMSAAALDRPDGRPAEVIVQFEDITARRVAEAALTDQALRDQVTGLPNRRALDDRLQAALSRLGRHRGALAVMFCDLDRFKDVNDSLGHHAGDELLVAVAQQLRSALRPSDSIARLGGDEFVVIGEDLESPGDAVAMAARLQSRLRSAWSGRHAFRPTMSIGVAVTTDATTSPEELLRRADLAMYRAKEKGRDRFEVYDQGIDDAVQRAVTVQQNLRRAIDESALELHYQPVVRLSDHTVVGAEALVRLRTSEGEVLSPAEFIAQAETSGLIVPMGALVLRRALADLARLDRSASGLYVAVNVSPTQLRDAGFAEFLLRQAELSHVPTDRILVEVTETALLHDPHRSAAELGALSAAGVTVALDDFGTGFSSLSWLTDFPVDVVKVDRSFTAHVVHDVRKAAVVRAITSASDAIGFSVVAEGIETREQLDRLVELGCHLGQGYLFGRPAPLSEAPWTTPEELADGTAHPHGPVASI